VQHLQNDTAVQPLRRTQTVAWGHCDPAGIIYTPRVLDYAVETLEAWNRDVLGVSWIKLNKEMSLGFPTVRVEVDFLKPPAVDHEVILKLDVIDVGRASLTTQVTGQDDTGADYFRVKLVSCLISVLDYTPCEINTDFRQRILAYQTACREDRDS
jgi:4-hydroxybenzoyl-CoA thioesterase